MNFDWLTDPAAPAIDPQPQRRWARRSLEVPEDAPGDMARLALLGRLEDEDFVPPEAWQEAAWVLEDEALAIASEPLPCFQKEQREELSKQVAAFAAEFFTFDPAARRARWMELQQHVEPGPLGAWLGLLKPGLDLRVESLEVEARAFHAILAGIRELLVLLPPQRALRRRKLVRELDFTQQEIERALTLLRLHCAEWVELADDFILALSQAHLHTAESASVIASGYDSEFSAGMSSAYTRQWVANANANYSTSYSTLAPAPKRRARLPEPENAYPWYTWLPFVLMGLGMFGVLSNANRSSPSTHWERAPSYPQFEEVLREIDNQSQNAKERRSKVPGRFEFRITPERPWTNDEAQETLDRALDVSRGKTESEPLETDAPSDAGEVGPP